MRIHCLTMLGINLLNHLNLNLNLFTSNLNSKLTSGEIRSTCRHNNSNSNQLDISKTCILSQRDFCLNRRAICNLNKLRMDSTTDSITRITHTLNLSPSLLNRLVSNNRPPQCSRLCPTIHTHSNSNSNNNLK